MQFRHALVALAVAGCASSETDSDLESTGGELGASTIEGFESGSKTAYAAASVALATGPWTMDDALIGSLSGDIRHGAAAARVRNSGHITMDFDRASGAGTVSIASATYGADRAGTRALFVSRDQGASWTAVGDPVTTGPAMATSSFTVELAGPVRLEIRKTDGGTNRIDIDDIAVDDPSGGGGGGGGGGGTGGAMVSVHTTLGLPSPASTSDANDFLSVKDEYVISYNSGRKVPNWVSWQLDSAYLGSTARTDAYRTDDTLPGSIAQATLSDYSGSGWDRGHMCPSADRNRTTTANRATFYLTNMVPQASNNNSGPWAKLETLERSLANSGKELFIVAGGIFSGSPRTIGNHVAVPSATWKVIAVLDHVGDDASSVTAATRVIAVIMPNDDAQIATSDTWQEYRVTVRDIEAQTGLDLLSDVDSVVQDIVETRVDDQ